MVADGSDAVKVMFWLSWEVKDPNFIDVKLTGKLQQKNCKTFRVLV